MKILSENSKLELPAVPPTDVGMSQMETTTPTNQRMFFFTLFLLFLLSLLLLGGFFGRKRSSLWMILGLLFFSLQLYKPLLGATIPSVISLNIHNIITGKITNKTQDPNFGGYYEDRQAVSRTGNVQYISVTTRIWGSCTPDMTGCTANRWKEKGYFHKQRFNANSTEVSTTSGNFYYGLGVSKFVSRSLGGVTTVGYGSEEGGSHGASETCFNYGPASYANSFDNPLHVSYLGAHPATPAWGLPCP